MCFFADLDDSRPKPSESSRRALRAYMTVDEYMETKRQLALNLLTCPEFVTLTTADPTATSVIRAVGLKQPLPADAFCSHSSPTAATL
jgi:hypothetical protein